eukprot:TRINITY_DN48296_c0_g1_i1.p1 TRINITY_DN48296_c0_g1~~TRINITY_DN48296_c0_g1_i1.p1  ORF type:complete len:146 (+),score=20.55 TRINITY_DN48296_c0_g1_i1:64-438(+)
MADANKHLKVLIRAAAQAICDSGGSMGASVDAMEQALAAQVEARGAASLEHIALLSSGLPQSLAGENVCIGEAGAGPVWTLSVGGMAGKTSCQQDVDMQGTVYLMPEGILSSSCENQPTKRRKS